MKKSIITLILSIFGVAGLSAQIGIGTVTPNASAALDVFSSSKGILLPRLNLSGRNDIATITSPANGLIAFNLLAAGTATNAVVANSLYFRQNSIWQKFASATELTSIAFSSQYVLESFTQQPFTATQLITVNNSETSDIPVTWTSADIYLDNTDNVELANSQDFKVLIMGQYRILANFTFNPKRNVAADNSNYTSVSFTVMRSQNNGVTWTAVAGTTMPFDNAASNETQTIIIPRTILSFNQNDLIRIVMTKPGGTNTPNYGTDSGIVSKAAADITKLIRIRKIN